MIGGIVAVVVGATVAVGAAVVVGATVAVGTAVVDRNTTVGMVTT